MTPGLRLTCDRVHGLCRAAVWHGGELVDLYVDSLTHPDMTEALVCAKAVRVARGGRAAWFDVDAAFSVYVENVGSLRAGEKKLIRIRTTRSGDKAATGVLEKGEGEALGVVCSPPPPWKRALLDVQEKNISCFFSSPEDREACQNSFSKERWVYIEPLFQGSVHPELDDIFETLTVRRVVLPCEGNIVIDQTEALTVIDINAPEGADPTTVNCVAMRVIARQLRLRNIGGMIVIDALKMKTRGDKGKVLGALNRALVGDPADPIVFDLTKLGLIEMTRTRRGPSLKENHSRVLSQSSLCGLFST